MELHSRRVLCWKPSNRLDMEFYREALEMTLSRGMRPVIFQSEQGCPFPSAHFMARLEGEEIKIS
jgi:transposase InsO family protein